MTVLLVIVEQLYQGMFHNIQAKCAIVIVFGGVIGGCFFFCILHFAFCLPLVIKKCLHKYASVHNQLARLLNFTCYLIVSKFQINSWN